MPATVAPAGTAISRGEQCDDDGPCCVRLLWDRGRTACDRRVLPGFEMTSGKQASVASDVTAQPYLSRRSPAQQCSPVTVAELTQSPALSASFTRSRRAARSSATAQFWQHSPGTTQPGNSWPSPPAPQSPPPPLPPFSPPSPPYPLPPPPSPPVIIQAVVCTGGDRSSGRAQKCNPWRHL